MVNLCVTVTTRVDLLRGMLRSAFAGTMTPDAVYLIDNSDRYPNADLVAVLNDVDFKGAPLGLTRFHGAERGSEAAAINWFLDHVAEERVIAHEDVVFGKHSLKTFVEATGDFLVDDSLGVIMYRDNCRASVGYYDEGISPGYYRYVDVDYEDRLGLAGIHPTVVPCGIAHLCNGTMKVYTPAERAEYERRHEIARVNYERKWNRPVTPGGNTIGRGKWRRAHAHA